MAARARVVEVRESPPFHRFSNRPPLAWSTGWGRFQTTPPFKTSGSPRSFVVLRPREISAEERFP